MRSLDVAAPASGRPCSSRCRRFTRRCWRPRARCRAGSRLGCAAASRPAKRCPAMSARAGASATGLDILDGLGSTEMLHIFLSNRPGDVRYGTHRQAGARLRVRILDDDGDAGPTARSASWWCAARPPPTATGTTARQVARTFRGEWTLPATPTSRTRRLLPLLRAARRHAQGRRHLGVAVRGRGRADARIRPSSKPPWSVARRGPADQAQGVCGAEIHRRRRARNVRRCASIAGASLPTFKYPRWIEFRTTLPKTATGKIQRFKLRAEAP